MCIDRWLGIRVHVDNDRLAVDRESIDPSFHPSNHPTTNNNTNSDVSLENVMLSRGKYGGMPLCRLIDLEMARPGREGAEETWGIVEVRSRLVIYACTCVPSPVPTPSTDLPIRL